MKFLATLDTERIGIKGTMGFFALTGGFMLNLTRGLAQLALLVVICLLFFWPELFLSLEFRYWLALALLVVLALFAGTAMYSKISCNWLSLDEMSLLLAEARVKNFAEAMKIIKGARRAETKLAQSRAESAEARKELREQKKEVLRLTEVNSAMASKVQTLEEKLEANLTSHKVQVAQLRDECRYVREIAMRQLDRSLESLPTATDHFLFFMLVGELTDIGGWGDEASGRSPNEWLQRMKDSDPSVISEELKTALIATYGEERFLKVLRAFAVFGRLLVSIGNHRFDDDDARPSLRKLLVQLTKAASDAERTQIIDQGFVEQLSAQVTV